MTRGKYSNRAEASQARTVMETEIETYQRKVRDLIAEVKELRETIETNKQVHRARVRQLQAEVTEGTSAALTAARMEVATLREQLGRVRGQSEEIHRKWGLMTEGVHKHFMTVHKMSGSEAIEALIGVLGEENMKVFVQNEDAMAARKGLPVEIIERMQRAQGRRK